MRVPSFLVKPDATPSQEVLDEVRDCASIMSVNTTSTTVLLLAVFGASTVEMVEAFTIVLAAGTRSWRSALEGALAAIVTLAVTVAVVGVPLVRYVPISALRAVVGGLLLLLGVSWLRKAILRAGGRKALHDEDAIFAATSRELAERAVGARAPKQRDSAAFAVSFKGVFLEGTEVVLIVISLGAAQHRLGLAALAAGAAAVVVALAGAIVAKQLSSVPENTIKLGVGVMITSFGLFWLGEGAGVPWPGSDLALLGILGVVSAVTFSLIAWLRAHSPRPRGDRPPLGQH